ncbi:DUF1345 domain-containing protein [Neorhizobium galegae]|uniref:DUF1345 domain-containing protein n=1 Tax=Neorhizobium galegae TaxID=399 RepID=UPI0006211154|nr:DUF1345 domain-containing protein [Neorhizobium galegae]CDZ27323.1 Hypothetical protein NGAL_HAMBI490_21670 [Neorhizobium galegae bv. officinalis]KAA9387323.1 DUF1345 domain-containing protein [Neorhizobium galegae]KAB1114468.1 DUF1345 domain-containing protein [Neorhizobium galegae]MCM2496971.1 DUF1345 domain-containing protein [Neorhizobium galegae]MCQ1771681.1 DUF1345 domain-containing protein [Neorhizobium galegae]
MPSPWHRLNHHRHGPFFAGTIASLACLPFLILSVPELAPGIAVIVFFLIYLVMMAVRIPKLDGATLRNKGQNDDEPAPVILGVTLLAVAAAVVSLFEALNRSQPASLAAVSLAFASVVLGWLTIHTMFAMHYAHRFWRPGEQAEENSAKRGGLDFPETDEPGAYDFLYFSFVIGMTAQTSDVQITSTGMRRINLLHAVVSFFFNTVLVAAAVNAVVSMGN